MPQEPHNPYPYPTAAEVEAAPSGRIEKAARNIATLRFDGIPRRAFLLGENDLSPVMQGLCEFVGEVYTLLDSLEGEINPQIEIVRKMMEDHRCPT